jgi:hypothetical protein
VIFLVPAGPRTLSATLTFSFLDTGSPLAKSANALAGEDSESMAASSILLLSLRLIASRGLAVIESVYSVACFLFLGSPIAGRRSR